MAAYTNDMFHGPMGASIHTARRSNPSGTVAAHVFSIAVKEGGLYVPRIAAKNSQAPANGTAFRKNTCRRVASWWKREPVTTNSSSAATSTARASRARLLPSVSFTPQMFPSGWIG